MIWQHRDRATKNPTLEFLKNPYCCISLLLHCRPFALDGAKFNTCKSHRPWLILFIWFSYRCGDCIVARINANCKRLVTVHYCQRSESCFDQQSLQAVKDLLFLSFPNYLIGWSVLGKFWQIISLLRKVRNKFPKKEEETKYLPNLFFVNGYWHVLYSAAVLSVSTLREPDLMICFTKSTSLNGELHFWRFKLNFDWRICCKNCSICFRWWRQFFWKNNWHAINKWCSEFTDGLQNLLHRPHESTTTRSHSKWCTRKFKRSELTSKCGKPTIFFTDRCLIIPFVASKVPMKRALAYRPLAQCLRHRRVGKHRLQCVDLHNGN